MPQVHCWLLQVLSGFVAVSSAPAQHYCSENAWWWAGPARPSAAAGKEKHFATRLVQQMLHPIYSCLLGPIPAPRSFDYIYMMASKIADSQVVKASQGNSLKQEND